MSRRQIRRQTDSNKHNLLAQSCWQEQLKFSECECRRKEITYLLLCSWEKNPIITKVQSCSYLGMKKETHYSTEIANINNRITGFRRVPLDMKCHQSSEALGSICNLVCLILNQRCSHVLSYLFCAVPLIPEFETYVFWKTVLQTVTVVNSFKNGFTDQSGYYL